MQISDSFQRIPNRFIVDFGISFEQQFTTPAVKLEFAF
jgi:hypothetical protein